MHDRIRLLLRQCLLNRLSIYQIAFDEFSPRIERATMTFASGYRKIVTPCPGRAIARRKRSRCYPAPPTTRIFILGKIGGLGR